MQLCDPWPEPAQDVRTGTNTVPYEDIVKHKDHRHSLAVRRRRRRRRRSVA
jgi:hypothetical protein